MLSLIDGVSCCVRTLNIPCVLCVQMDDEVRAMQARMAERVKACDDAFTGESLCFLTSPSS